MPPHPRKARNRAPGPWPVGACPDCGKQRFLSRRDAKRTAGRLDDGVHTNAYRCGDYWHWGHTPDAEWLQSRRGR